MNKSCFSRQLLSPTPIDVEKRKRKSDNVDQQPRGCSDCRGTLKIVIMYDSPQKTYEKSENLAEPDSLGAKLKTTFTYQEHSLVRSSSVQECDSYLKIWIVEGKYLLE